MEMNMHVPQSITAATELRFLASVLRQIISPRTNSPIIQLFQDTMTGAYRMTQEDIQIPEDIAMNMLAKIKRPVTRKNRPWTGSEIISYAFPLMNFNGGGVKVKNGELIEGTLKKGGSVGPLVHIINNDFSPHRAGQWINDMQSIVTQYNLYTGFSVGTSDLIADKGTLDFVKEKMNEGRQAVAEILSEMHAGRFQNTSGLTDGENLEEKIRAAMNKVAADINKEVIGSLPKDNRIVQMVASGSKGAEHNITQMMGLLAQQLIEGKRVQYTLQDRTLPHFARFDDGVESRGFIEHSFVEGLMPAEFFYHAQAGREGLIDTAVKTSDTGYIQRRLMKMMEDLRVMYDGTVRNAAGTIVQYAHGDDGIDPVCVESQPCDLALMTLEDIYRNFALSAEDVNPFLAAPVDQVQDLVDDIITDRDMLVKSVFRFRKNDVLQAPVHMKRLVEKYSNPYSTKSDLTPAYIVAEIQKFVTEFPGNKVFHCLLRFYLAPKKVIMNYRMTQSLFDELMRDVRFRYMKSLVHSGEMVGAVAAQSIGEPTTQLTLNTFHSAGTAKANATSGVPRIEELLSASANPKRPGNTIYLEPSIAMTENTTISKMKEIQKTMFRDIVKNVRIYYDPFPLSSNSVVQEDAELLELYEAFAINNANECASPWIMRIELNDLEMEARGVNDLTLIQTKLENNSALRIVKCLHSDPSAKKLVLRLTFEEGAVKTPVHLRFLEDKVLDTVLTGIDGISRVHLRLLKKEVIYDDKVGGYTPVKQYVLDADGTNMYDLMTFSGVDATRTFSNDIHEINEVFGIEAVRLALYEEFNEVFEMEKVNYHHLATLVDTMTYQGRIVAINRFGMPHIQNGTLAQSSFEETAKIMFNAAVEANFDPMKGVSANIMFGQKPPCGTGLVDILMDETRLPEGSAEDEEAVEKETLDKVNEKLEKEVDSVECDKLARLMEW